MSVQQIKGGIHTGEDEIIDLVNDYEVTSYKLTGKDEDGAKKYTRIRHRVEIRLDQSTSDDLDFCVSKLNTTKTEVIKKGISLVKKEIEKK